ncbi:MAG TPA: DEAD/DEAH box helicase [Actinomycetes bacterium]|nr:DEAD/DEAH box helicase [Actinomycetes bacterium]
MPPRTRRRGTGRAGLQPVQPDRAPRRSAAPRRDQQGPVPVLADAARRVATAVENGRVTATTPATFQAIALLARELRVKAKADTDEKRRTNELRRLDGLGEVLVRTAARNASLIRLLADDAPLLPGTNASMRELRERAGMTQPAAPVVPAAEGADGRAVREERQVVPQSVIARQLSNPFLAPDFSAAPAPATARPVRLLADWELIEPLLRSFEEASPGSSSCMPLPPPSGGHIAAGRDLMPHQAQVVAAARTGHRSFLLADEPGLGKTAQALLAASAADAYPLLVVVPNVVKTSWAREAAMWTPSHPATVVHSDGDTIDAFSDIVIVNYDILNRHVGWLGTFGFRGMVVDEAHFIKNKSSQRSRNVLELSRRVRQRTMRPLLMALTGTPLINDIEDFLAIWEFLGWIEQDRPSPQLLQALERNGYTPIDRGFYPAARQTVIDLGIVRRRKEEVAKDIPERRIADVPVELTGANAKSIRDAERRLVQRLVKRYDSALAVRRERGDDLPVDGIDHELVRQVAAREIRDADEAGTGENVFSMMRRIGTAKAELAADFTAQLSHNAGKVVFFAKHIDVMDTAEAAFAKRGISCTSIRGDQTTRVRQRNIDAFVNDPDVAVIVCSLTAAGVGINLQVASNVVLAELSWTAAEQAQAIDRVHRIGQGRPVTAWRILAAQTVDSRVAELIDAKAGLAARALDGVAVEAAEVDVQLETLVTLLTNALADRLASG